MKTALSFATLSLSAVALSLAGGVPALAQQAPASVSTPAAPAAPAQQQRPNVLVWMMDDVGYAQISSFGGLVETPNIDRVAHMGLRYANYHTAPICSAARASFLTGRMPHSVHIGGHATAARPGLEGYDGRIPANAGTIAANLKAAGYATFALGKWDHLPNEDVSSAGPQTFWPMGQGFDRFYGFLAADTNNFDPSLVRDTTAIGRPRDPAYHLSADLADQAIAMIEGRAATDPRRPFFMYWATGAAHAPHHAPAEWIARYKGRFDQGWDKVRETILARQVKQGLVPRGTRLAPRPDGLPAWDSLSADEKRLYARQMEAFAAALSYADAQFGRLLDALAATGELDDTMVIVTSDNGASAEGGPFGLYNEAQVTGGTGSSVATNLPFVDSWGGPRTYPHYSYGWAVAGDTPMRYYKQTTHEGGTRVPLVISWPKGIAARGETRQAFVHVADIAPTILGATQVPLAPVVNNVPQVPMEGQDVERTFASASAPGHEGPQYVELYGNKGLWQDGWAIVTSHRTRTWDWQTARTFDEPWELYDLTRDPGQATDLAAKHPDRVAAMAAAWQAQAERYHVFPQHNLSDTAADSGKRAMTDFARRGGKWHYPGPLVGLSSTVAPPLNTRGFSMTATLDLTDAGATVPVFASGGALGGIGLYLDHGKPVLRMNAMDGTSATVAADEALPLGQSRITLEVDRRGGSFAIAIRAGDRVLAQGQLAFALPSYFGVPETFDIGSDTGSPVYPGYAMGTAFPGRISDVTFDFNGRGGGALQLH